MKWHNATVLGLAVVAACSSSSDKKATSPQPQPSPGCLNLVVNAKAGTSADYPAVVRLISKVDAQNYGVCTGTFISPTALITAAHCVNATPNGGIFLVPGDSVAFNSNPDPLAHGVAARKVFTMGAVGETGDPNDPNVTAKDTAIALFPAGTATAYMSIASSRAPDHAVVTSVGYGLTTLSNAGQDPHFNASKHFGTTTIFPTTDTLNITVGGVTYAQSSAANGTQVINSNGDSGGPLLYNDKLVAVLSSGGEANSQGPSGLWITSFVDVTSAATKALIAQANQGGAGIPAPDSVPTLTGSNSNSATTTVGAGAPATTCAAAASGAGTPSGSSPAASSH